MYRTEYLSYKQQLAQSAEYITNLENQQSIAKDKIDRLNKIAERYNQKTELPEGTLQYAAQGKNRALVELNAEVNRKNPKIYGDKNK